MTPSGRSRRPPGRALGALLAATAAIMVLGAAPVSAAPGDPTDNATVDTPTPGGTVQLTPTTENPYAAGALPAPDPGRRVTWAVQPASDQGPDGRVSFRHEVAPGASITDHVTVTNYADHDVTFRLYASDGVTTADGVFDLLPAATPPSDGGSWVTLDRPEVTIGARQSVTVPFSITVPADATPGDHPAGIVATLSTSAGADGAVSMERRVGARIHLRVPGEITPMLQVQNLSADFTGQWSLTEGGASTIAMDLVNTGNVRLAGDATLQISGPLGLWNRSIELGTIPEILPRNQIHVTATADDVPPLIMLTHQVRIRLATVGDDQVGELPTPEPEYARVSAMPWLWLIILLAVVGLIAYLVQSRSRARRQLAAALARADGVDGDGGVAGGKAGDGGVESREGSSGDSPGAEVPDGPPDDVDGPPDDADRTAAGSVGAAPVERGGRHRP